MSDLNLSPNYGTADSPGSSIFDLPTQPSRTTSGPSTKSPSVNPATPNAEATDALDQPDHAPEKGGEAGPSFLVVSGGTGCNSICAAFGNACYVLPVSDDGGSSSEIIRVLGGPSIGEFVVYWLGWHRG